MTRMDRTRIKVCGVRTIDDALAAAEAGADAVGLMFVESSPRSIDPDEAFAIVSSLPPMVASVAVLKDASIEEFSEQEQRCPTTLTQLHGSEPDKVVRACGPALVKAVRFDRRTIGDTLAHYSAMEEVDAILVDGSAGGAGEAFDWRLLAENMGRATKPVIVAGGLDPDNVGEAIRAVRPFAVDVSSGVERERGVKDPARIRAFCQAVRAADAEGD